jgi:hypothetical protein
VCSTALAASALVWWSNSRPTRQLAGLPDFHETKPWRQLSPAASTAVPPSAASICAPAKIRLSAAWQKAIALEGLPSRSSEPPLAALQVRQHLLRRAEAGRAAARARSCRDAPDAR